MYTIVPFHGRHEVARPLMNDLLNDRFFRSFFDMTDMVGTAGFRVDVREQGDAYLLEAELPGVKQDDIKLSVDNGVLTISADVNAEKHNDHDGYLYSERRSGHMERSFSLEGIAEDSIAAAYKDGILTVTLPKDKPAPRQTARQICITGE